MASSSVLCKYNQTGYCKYKSSCRNHHVNELCLKSKCDDTTCSLRHPRRCKFFLLFGHCKFKNDCAYLHPSEVVALSSNIETKTVQLEEKVDIIDHNFKKLAVKVDQFEAASDDLFCMSEKLKMLEIEIEELKVSVEEKEKKIEHLTNLINTSNHISKDHQIVEPKKHDSTPTCSRLALDDSRHFIPPIFSTPPYSVPNSLNNPYRRTSSTVPVAKNYSQTSEKPLP